MSKDLRKQIERLKTYNESPAPILSVYFQLPVPKLYSSETIVNKLQTHINAGLSYEQREEMKKHIQMIAGFMQNYQQARGEHTLAFFSGGDNLFEILHLPYRMKSTVVYSHDPYLLPVLNEMDDMKRYLVILSDKKNAIFYTMFDGAVEAKDSLFDDSVPQDINHIGSQGLRTQRDDKTQRHIHEHAQKHFQLIAERVQQFIKNKPIAGVIIGGHKHELSQFKEHLPKHLQEKIVGDFISELHVGFNEILERSKRVIQQLNPQVNPQTASA